MKIAGQSYWLWRGVQRFISTQSATRNSFSVPTRFRAALTIRYHRLEAFEAWKSVANVA